MPLRRSEIDRIFTRPPFKDDPKRPGAVIIDASWIKKNIVRIETPFGTFPVHRLVARQIQAFLEVGHKYKLINDCGGIQVARKKMWDPQRDLSEHAYGIAPDVNVDDGKDGAGGQLNMGANSHQPAALIKLGELLGLECGTAWRGWQDGMHFSAIRILSAPETQAAIDAFASLMGEAKVKEPRMLMWGDAGEDVRELQGLLNKKINAFLKIDGQFGKATAGAVVKFQAVNGIKASGRVDAGTWAKLRG